MVSSWLAVLPSKTNTLGEWVAFPEWFLESLQALQAWSRNVICEWEFLFGKQPCKAAYYIILLTVHCAQSCRELLLCFLVGNFTYSTCSIQFILERVIRLSTSVEQATFAFSGVQNRHQQATCQCPSKVRELCNIPRSDIDLDSNRLTKNRYCETLNP